MKDTSIAVIGLGYVGLPLAVALARHFPTIGFDISRPRIDELRNGFDRTDEVEPARLRGFVQAGSADPARYAPQAPRPDLEGAAR